MPSEQPNPDCYRDDDLEWWKQFDLIRDVAPNGVSTEANLDILSSVVVKQETKEETDG